MRIETTVQTKQDQTHVFVMEGPAEDLAQIVAEHEKFVFRVLGPGPQVAQLVQRSNELAAELKKTKGDDPDGGDA